MLLEVAQTVCVKGQGNRVETGNTHVNGNAIVLFFFKHDQARGNFCFERVATG